MNRYGGSELENSSAPVVLFVAQSGRFFDEYATQVAQAVERLGGHLILVAPEGAIDYVDRKHFQDIVLFPPFDPGTITAFQEAHRWNVLMNRRMSRSFNYRSKTQFPTWYVSLLKAKREILLRRNKIRELGLARGNPGHGLPKRLSDIRQSIGLVFTALILVLSSIRAPVQRILSLARISSVKGRQEVLELIAATPSGSVVGKILDSTQPDLVVVPTLGHELIPTEAIRAASGKSPKSLLLVDNWDNLSSKSVFATLPDYVGTWGPQSSDHAVNIQGIRPECVFDLGAPRFESHFKIGAHQTRRPAKSRRYILYCGTSMFSREDRILQILDDTLGKFGVNVPVVYRPHPQRFTKPGRGLRNRNGLIRIDPSTPKEFWGTLRPYGFHRDMSLPEKLLGSDFIIGGLTSVLLEAEIVGKRYLAMAHRERFNYSSPRTVYETYDHYRGVEDLPHLTICKNLRDLPGLVADHVEQPDIPLNPEQRTRERSHFLVGSSTEAYSDRLASAMEVILRQSRDL